MNDRSFTLWRSNPTGLCFTVKGAMKKSIKENDDPKLMIMDSALLSQVSFALVGALTTFFVYRSGWLWLWGDYPLVGWTCRGGLAFYLMYTLSTSIGPDTDRSQRPPFWKSILVILASMVLWLNLSSLQQKLPASQPQSSPFAPLPLAIWELPFSPFASISKETFQASEVQAHHVIKKVKTMAYSILSSADSKFALKHLPKFSRKS